MAYENHLVYSYRMHRSSHSGCHGNTRVVVYLQDHSGQGPSIPAYSSLMLCGLLCRIEWWLLDSQCWTFKGLWCLTQFKKKRQQKIAKGCLNCPRSLCATSPRQLWDHHLALMSFCGICFPYSGEPESAISGWIKDLSEGCCSFFLNILSSSKHAVWPVGHNNDARFCVPLRNM